MHLLMGLSKYRVSIYALSMLIHHPYYKHRIPNGSPELIFQWGIVRRILELVYRGAYIQGDLYLGFYGMS